MKIKALLFLLTFAMVFTGCKKDNYIPNLEGTWTVTRSFGGYVDPLANPAAPINLQFRFSGNTVQLLVGGQVVESGTFSLEQASRIINGDNVKYKLNLFTSAATGGYSVYINVKGQILAMYVGEIAADGFVRIYERD
ncbi:MAG: hypothetical protein EOO04_26300 [Chitinophagaceae bacterium]|nr:MAG: hypothetical protein EOO04_26300 [Chitinophagaceae bacterium]